MELTLSLLVFISFYKQFKDLQAGACNQQAVHLISDRCPLTTLNLSLNKTFVCLVQKVKNYC